MPPGFHPPGLEAIEDFSVAWIVVASLLSIIGLALFVYGKRSKNLLHVSFGVLFMVYPIVVSNVAVMLGIGVALGGFLWWVGR